jgi:hypothetical protein
MLRSNSMCRLIAGIATAMLLLCQTAMAAAACVPTFTQADADSAQAACHQPPGPDAAADGHARNDNCPPGCQSGHASFEPAKIQVYAAADLPLLTARITLTQPTTRFAVPGEAFLAHSVSPPLPIVLCRLLN